VEQNILGSKTLHATRGVVEIHNAELAIEGLAPGWANVFFGRFFENYGSSPTFWATFYTQFRFSINFDNKMGWSIFKASFSRTLLVTHRPLL
jgi:hypothetical protein